MVIDFDVLYINKEKLRTYNRTIPETWDELITTSQYILNEELKLNNTNFVPYNGLFSTLEVGICSLYEFIYSFRKSKESPFPEITSQEVVDALYKMKEMKEKIGSDIIFKSNEDFTAKKFSDSNFLFLKYWYLPVLTKTLDISPLPGIKKGISGSVIGGHNIGINMYSNIQKRNAVIEAFKFLTSKEMHKKYIAKNNYLTPISSLYDEDEVCKVVNCDFFKSIQLIGRPVTKSDDYIKYADNFKKKCV